jgi:hypothetical protein
VSLKRACQADWTANSNLTARQYPSLRGKLSEIGAKEKKILPMMIGHRLRWLFFRMNDIAQDGALRWRDFS